MAFDLSGKVIVITGASSGIGYDLAKGCARKGAKVLACARSVEPLNQLASSESGDSGLLHTLVADVRKHDDIQSIARKAMDTWGRIDVLINNAGYGVNGSFAETPLSVVRENFETNFFGALALTKEILPSMLQQKSGLIVNIESIVALRGMPMTSSYSATKHAMHAWSEAMRIELEAHNIQVLSVCPGLIRTRFSENKMNIAGTTEPTPGWLHLSSEKCAEIILRAMERQRRRIIITGHAKILAWLQRLSPRLTDLIVARNYPKYKSGK